MGEVVVIARQDVPGPPQRVFSRFGRATAGGWLFDAECDEVAPGSVLRFCMPGPSGTRIPAVGRIIDVQSGERVVVIQESPWRSRIEVTFRPHAHGTTVTATATVDDDGLAWLMSLEGCSPRSQRVAGEIRIGVMLSLSGPAAVFGPACRNSARLAVEEINQDGGLRGRRLRAVISDDGTEPRRARAEYLRLVDREQCHVVVAMISSASMATIRPLARARRDLLLHCPIHEGLRSAGTVFHLGQDPASQLRWPISEMMARSGEHGWAFIGNDYNWPRAVHSTAGALISGAGGALLTEQFVPLGQESFDDVIDTIASSGATNVISAMVGTDAVRFERSFHAAGLRNDHLTFSLLFDEAVREHVGDAAAAGIWSVQTFFREHDAPTSRELGTRWSQRFGPMSPPLTSTAATVYDAVHRYVAAARRARSLDPAQVARAVAAGSSPASSCLLPRGLLAEAAPGGFLIRSDCA